MKTRNQRDQWADHLRDEAAAREAEQAAAGGSHEPVQGPLPYSADDLEDAIAAQVRQERERCAAIAERWCAQLALQDAFPDATDAELRAAAEAARRIALAIRAGQQR